MFADFEGLAFLAIWQVPGPSRGLWVQLACSRLSHLALLHPRSMRAAILEAQNLLQPRIVSLENTTNKNLETNLCFFILLFLCLSTTLDLSLNVFLHSGAEILVHLQFIKTSDLRLATRALELSFQ
jgi:hypothetical protein